MIGEMTCAGCHTILHHSADTCYYCGRERYKWTIREDDKHALSYAEVAAMALFNEFKVVRYQRRWGAWSLTSSLASK